VSVPDFDKFIVQFVYDVKAIVQLAEIPDSLVINWDHSGINYVPISSWTMDEEGKKRV